MKKERKINIFYKFAFALFFLMVCINTKAVNVSAASAEVSVRASSGQVSKGDIVYVIITVNSSDAMSGFEGSFSYDSRVLQYMTGGSVAIGNDNRFQIEDTGRETGVNSLKYSIKFVARKEGSTSIELKQPYAVYNSEDSSKMSVSSDTLNIMVKSKSAKKADAPQKNDNKEPDGKEPAGTEKPYDGKKNNDESAKDDIKPSESPKPKTKKKKINADDKKNTTKDAVKSVTATYQNSVITIHYNEEYKVVPLENDKDIPTGFGKTEIVLSGHVITAYATEDNLEHKFVLIYCKCGRQEPEFYLYDTENDSFMPYDKVKAWYKESIGNTVVGSDSVSETKLKTMKYIVGIMVIICLLMFIGMITIYLHYRQNNNIISAYGGILDGSAGGIDNAGTVDSTDTIEYMGKIKHTYGENMPKFDSLKDGMSKKDVSGTDISEKEMLGDNNEKTDLDLFEEKSNNITHYWHRE